MHSAGIIPSSLTDKFRAVVEALLLARRLLSVNAVQVDNVLKGV